VQQLAVPADEEYEGSNLYAGSLTGTTVPEPVHQPPPNQRNQSNSTTAPDAHNEIDEKWQWQHAWLKDKRDESQCIL
jgi:hypothetical protein